MNLPVVHFHKNIQLVWVYEWQMLDTNTMQKMQSR